jgi:hypothetical protein
MARPISDHNGRLQRNSEAITAGHGENVCSHNTQPIDCQSSYAPPCELKRVYSSAVVQAMTAVKSASLSVMT